MLPLGQPFPSQDTAHSGVAVTDPRGDTGPGTAVAPGEDHVELSGFLHTLWPVRPVCPSVCVPPPSPCPPPQANADPSVINCLHTLSRRIATVLQHEERRCQYLTREAKLILALQDEVSAVADGECRGASACAGPHAGTGAPGTVCRSSPGARKGAPWDTAASQP